MKQKITLAEKQNAMKARLTARGSAFRMESRFLGKIAMNFSERAVQLYQQGKSIREIALDLGYRENQGQNRIRTALRKAGVYKEPSKQAKHIYERHGHNGTPEHIAYLHARERGDVFQFVNFRQFLTAVGYRPSARYCLVRINANEPYRAGNVKWMKPSRPPSRLGRFVRRVVRAVQKMARPHAR